MSSGSNMLVSFDSNSGSNVLVSFDSNFLWAAVATIFWFSDHLWQQYFGELRQQFSLGSCGDNILGRFGSIFSGRYCQIFSIKNF
jgi:hypothetical protein